MDEQQFGGRTDDDLFADDFEPVEPTKTPDQTPAEPVHALQPAETVQPQGGNPVSSSSPPKTPAATPAKGASSGRRSRSSRAKAGGGAPKAAAGDASHPKQQQTQKPSNSHPPAPGVETLKAPPPPSLAQSRHYQPPQPATTPAASPPAAAVATPGAQQKKQRNGVANGAGRETPAKKRENGSSSSPVPNGGAKAGEQQKQEPAANKKPNANGKAARGKANDASRAPAGPANTPKTAQGSGKTNGNSNGNTGGNAATPNVAGKPAAAGNAAVKPNGARTQSGANPRSKLTEAELNAKMEAMRIASAEKARLFEQAQRDELDHDRAVARGMEEARKRKAADEERRKRTAEEEKRRRAVEEEKRRKAAQETKIQDEERARNRDRKLKALGAKEGNWDAGKDTTGNGKPPGSGGVASGMQASRHAPAGILPVPNAAAVTATKAGAESTDRIDTDRPVDEFHIRGRGGRGRNGGRGSGRGGGRRGGRPLFDDVYGNGADVADWVKGQPDPSAMAPPHGATQELSQEAFPTLPGGGAGKPADPAPSAAANPSAAATENKPKEQAKSFSAVASSPAKVPLPELQPLSPAVGDWADEVEVATMDQTLGK